MPNDLEQISKLLQKGEFKGKISNWLFDWLSTADKITRAPKMSTPNTSEKYTKGIRRNKTWCWNNKRKTTIRRKQLLMKLD